MPNKEILLKTTQTWDGDELKPSKIDNPEVTVLKIAIPPHERLTMHKHPMLNVVYLNKGRLTIVTKDGQEKTIKKGECLTELIDKFHYGKNDTNEDTELIVFYFGEKDEKLSIEE